MLAAGFADMHVIFLDMQCSKTSVGSVGKPLKFIINKIHLQMKLSGSAAVFFVAFLQPQHYPEIHLHKYIFHLTNRAFWACRKIIQMYHTGK